MITFKAYIKSTVKLPNEEFPKLLENHLSNVKKTKEIELHEALLVKKNFNDWESTKEFIISVCGWGNYSGIYGRVLKNNNKNHIIDNFKKASKNITSAKSDLIEAIDNLCELHGLGVSFASKHLRFLFPKICPVLDRLLADYLDYELSSEDYKKFSDFCLSVANELNSNNINNPFPGRKLWYCCDVEASLFSYFNNWK